MLQPEHLIYASSLIAAFVAALLVTPVVRYVARRIGFVDRPDGGRKSHKVAVSLGGGLAVFLSMLITIGLVSLLSFAQGLELCGPRETPIMLGLLAASALTVVLGLVDDSITLRGRIKLLGQIVIASLLIWVGLRIERFTLFGTLFELGIYAYPFTLFWLLGTINAVNLIDGIDGLASSVGVVLCLTVATINGVQGHFIEAILMLALAGALLGFLRYNFAPASIYLGDTGSMLIGLLIGAIAVHTSVKSPAAIAMAVPLTVWSIPILDSAAAILRRKLTGRSLFAADRGHLHHSLLVRGWSVRKSALFITLICAFTCLGAVGSFLLQNETLAIATVLGIVSFLIVSRTFGHVEFALVKDHFKNSLFTFKGDADDPFRNQGNSYQLQGCREWGKLWSAIIESAEDYNLMKFKLTIYIPALHESFYATWKSSQIAEADTDRLWNATHPLVIDGQTVGSVDMSGLPEESSRSTIAHMIQALDFLEPIEDDIRQIREQIRLDHSSMKLRQTSDQRAERTAPPPSPPRPDVSTPIA